MGQRERIGSEFVQLRIFEPKRWLNVTPHLLLAEDAGDVVSAEGASSLGFFQCHSDRVGTVITNQQEQFANLPGERAIGVSEPFQIRLRGRSEQND